MIPICRNNSDRNFQDVAWAFWDVRERYRSMLGGENISNVRKFNISRERYGNGKKSRPMWEKLCAILSERDIDAYEYFDYCYRRRLDGFTEVYPNLLSTEANITAFIEARPDRLSYVTTRWDSDKIAYHSEYFIYELSNEFDNRLDIVWQIIKDKRLDISPIYRYYTCLYYDDLKAKGVNFRESAVWQYVLGRTLYNEFLPKLLLDNFCG